MQRVTPVPWQLEADASKSVHRDACSAEGCDDAGSSPVPVPGKRGSSERHSRNCIILLPCFASSSSASIIQRLTTAVSCNLDWRRSMRVLGRHKPADSPQGTSVQMDASSPAAASQIDACFEEGLMFWQDGYASRPGCGMLVLARKPCRQDSVSPGEATVLTC